MRKPGISVPPRVQQPGTSSPYDAVESLRKGLGMHLPQQQRVEFSQEVLEQTHDGGVYGRQRFLRGSDGVLLSANLDVDGDAERLPNQKKQKREEEEVVQWPHNRPGPDGKIVPEIIEFLDKQGSMSSLSDAAAVLEQRMGAGVPPVEVLRLPNQVSSVSSEMRTPKKKTEVGIGLQPPEEKKSPLPAQSDASMAGSPEKEKKVLRPFHSGLAAAVAKREEKALQRQRIAEMRLQMAKEGKTLPKFE